MIQDEFYAAKNLLSYNQYDNSSDQEIPDQNDQGNKITQIYIFLLLGVGLFFGVAYRGLPLALSLSGAFGAIYLVVRLFYITSERIKYISMITLFALAFQIFHLSHEMGLLYFFLLVLNGILILYKDVVLIWASVIISVIHSIAIAFLSYFKLLNIDGQKLMFYNLLFLAFSYLCTYITAILKKSAQNEMAINTELNKHLKNEEQNISFANQITSGNLDALYTPEEDNKLGRSLIEMSNGLKQSAEEEEIRNWQIAGIAKVSELLRLYSNNVEELSLQVLTLLIKYLKANQGGLFLLNDEDPDQAFLELKASYAYTRKKHNEKIIQIGEGFAGRAFLEKEPIYIKQLPEDYFPISSGLGNSNPKSLIVVPIILEENVVGIIEIASLSELKAHEREFLEKASQSIASTIIASKRNSQTSSLLSESREMTEQLRAHEEEMRQNLEELHATQEDLHRKNQEKEQAEQKIKTSQIFLNGLLNALPTPVFVKNRAHDFVLANKAYCDYVGFSSDQVFTLSRKEIFGDMTSNYWEKDEQAFLLKETISRESKLTDAEGNEKRYIVTKSILTTEDNEDFLIGILIDISDRKKHEQGLMLEKLMLESLINNFPDRIYFKDVEGKFLRVNKAKAIRHGLNDPALIIGKSDFDYFSRDHAQKTLAEEKEIITKGKLIINLEEKIQYADGTFGWGSTSKMPLKDLKGKSIGTYGITRDITGEKNAGLKVDALNEILKKVGNALPIIFYKINKDKIITEWFGAGRKAILLNTRDVLGKSIEEIVPGITKHIETKLDKEIIFSQKYVKSIQTHPLEHHLFQDPSVEGGLIGFAIQS